MTDSKEKNRYDCSQQWTIYMVCKILGPPEFVVFCFILLFLGSLWFICQVLSFKWLCIIFSSPESAISVQKRLSKKEREEYPSKTFIMFFNLSSNSLYFIIKINAFCFSCVFISSIDGYISFHKITRTKVNIFWKHIETIWAFFLYQGRNLLVSQSFLKFFFILMAYLVRVTGANTRKTKQNNLVN